MVFTNSNESSTGTYGKHPSYAQIIILYNSPIRSAPTLLRSFKWPYVLVTTPQRNVDLCIHHNILSYYSQTNGYIGLEEDFEANGLA